LFAFDNQKEPPVIKWAIIFFIISLIAGAFGFTGAAARSSAGNVVSNNSLMMPGTGLYGSNSRWSAIKSPRISHTGIAAARVIRAATD
jgi:hypothetical protein